MFAQRMIISQSAGWGELLCAIFKCLKSVAMAKKRDKSSFSRNAVLLVTAPAILCASSLSVLAQTSAPSWNDVAPVGSGHHFSSPAAKKASSSQTPKPGQAKPATPTVAPRATAAAPTATNRYAVTTPTAKDARPWLKDVRLLDGKPIYGPPRPPDLQFDNTTGSGTDQTDSSTSSEQTPWLGDVRLLDGKPIYGPPTPMVKTTDVPENKRRQPTPEEQAVKEKPWLGDVRLLDGKPLYGPSNDQAADATSDALQFSELNPAQLKDDAKTLLQKGLVAAHEGDWQSALTFFLSAASSSDNSAETFYHVGVACYHLGKFEHARTAETIAIGLDAQFQPAYVELATIECKLGHYREARESIQEALKHWPNQESLQHTLLSIKALEKKSSATIATTPSQKGGFEVSPLSKPALLFNAKDINGLYHDSELALQQGDLLRAKTSLQFAVILNRQDPEPHWRLCNVLEAEGDTRGAVLEAKRSVALDPTNPQWYLALGWAYSREAKWEHSFEAFKEAFKRDYTLHDAIVGECYALAKQKQFILARITLHISDPAARDTSWFHAANGLILQEKGELISAYKELQTALEISPNDYQIKYVFARISYQLACKQKTTERWKIAAKDARSLLAITPYDVEVLVNLGICQMNSSDNEGAEKTLAHAIKLSPSNAGAQAAYASVLAASGKTDEAKHHARLAKKIDPSQKLAETILQKLK
jgi:tetratricopeptide (TPR) repeat protein